MGKSKPTKRPTYPKPKPKKAKAAAPPKPTIEQLSDMDRRRLMLDHKRRIKPLIAEHKETASALREAYELAKAEGIPKKMIDLAILKDTEEGKRKLLAQWQMIGDVDRYTGKEIGIQLEFFDKPSTPSAAAYADGELSALSHMAAIVPSHLVSHSQSWLEGHAAGCAQVKAANTSALTGFKKLGDTATAAAVDSLAEHKEAA